MLSITINGLFFQTKIQCNIDPPSDVFSQVREFRNDILHDAKLEITDNDVTKYLNTIVAVLEDNTTLINDPSAQAAVKKIKEILHDDLVITTTEENKAVQIALDAITKAKEQAEESVKKLADAKTAEIHSSVCAEFDDKYEPALEELKQSHDDHENRLQAVEREQRETKNRLLQLENQVSSLKIAEEKHKKRSDFLKQKQDLQQYLMDQYQTHHVKTWISPQNNNVDIEDVYVSPDLVIDKKDDNMVNTTDDSEKRTSRPIHIQKTGESGNFTQTKVSRYRDLFNTRDTKNKRIYVIGDVGTGKSSFLKMMMRNWCTSMTSRRNNVEKDASKKQQGLGHDADIQNISAFEFLFYIPLRFMSGCSDVLEMIKSQLPDYHTLLDETVVDNSECCLILLDGLDEWSPPEKNETVLQHVTYGIPASFSFRNATVITTSRPSARGILDMKLSECDLRVRLMGIKQSSVQSMIKKYMRVTPINQLSSGKFLDCETCEKELLSMGHLHETPMLLQQMIWMYCHGNEIGKSISYTYTNIINILLAWVHEKIKKSLQLNQTSHLRDIKLPNLFDKYERCQENHQLILFLGKVAYDTFVAEEGSAVVFGRSKLKQLGLSDSDISDVLQFGILVEENSNDPTYEKSQISFIHTSFLEFFTAIFISSSYNLKAETSQSEADILEKLVNQQPSSADILRLQNVLIMVCGLSPFLTKRVYECIYKYQAKVNMQNTNDLREEYNIKEKIQDMCFQCLSECNCSKHLTSSKDQTCFQVKLHDIIVKDDIQCLLKVIPTDVQTFYLTDSHTRLGLHDIYLYLDEIWQDYDETWSNNDKPRSDFDESWSDYDDPWLLCYHEPWSDNDEPWSVNYKPWSDSDEPWSDCDDEPSSYYDDILSDLNKTSSHEYCSSLSSFLSEAVSIRTLKVNSIACTKDDCNGHTINISNHGQLTSLHLDKCDQICVSGVNKSFLETCEITYCSFSHDICSSLSLLLSQAVSIRTLKLNVSCTRGDCEGHCIDLSNHTQLSRLNLIRCSNICVSGGNNNHFETCEVTSCTLIHNLCSALSSFLSQAVSLRKLKLKKVACLKGDCTGHCIDLSNHAQLSSLYLQGCNQIGVSGGKILNFETCDITACIFSHELCSRLSSFLSQAVSTKMIKINDVACTKSECEGHCIDLSYHTQLSSLSLQRCNQICVSGRVNTHLEICKITECKFSHDLCSSLFSFLSQAVSLRTFIVQTIACTNGDCKGHCIDLSNQTQLSRMYLHGSKQICISGGNIPNFETCDVIACTFSHDHCSSLSSFLSQAVSTKTLVMKDVACTKGDCEGHSIDLSKHTQLSSMYLQRCNQICVSGRNNTHLDRFMITDCKFSHDVCSSLSSFLSQAVSLKRLKVKDVVCSKADCVGHCIDLSNHAQLPSLHLRGCNQIGVSGGNNNHLERCSIKYCTLSHELCSSLSSFLSQGVSLKRLEIIEVACTKSDCEGHSIGLSNHTHLSSLYLHGCNQIGVSDGNNSHLERCSIQYCTLSHDLCSSLSSFLSQAVSLEMLKVIDVACTKADCKDHCIDLSNHTQLSSLNLHRCNQMCVSGRNNTHLEICKVTDCKFSHDLCSSFLSQAVSLLTLVVRDVTCTKGDCEGHCIDMSNHTQLSSLILHRCNQICVSAGNNIHLERCEIIDCKFSHELCSSMSSFLSQAVSLRTLDVRDVACTKPDCEGHCIDISKNTQLSSLFLQACKQTCESRGNYPPLWKCVIIDCKFSHDVCSSVSSFLSRAVLLTTLKVKDIACIKPDCEGHCIDLSKYIQLSSLYLHGCNQIRVSGRNNTGIKSCDITDCKFSHDVCSSLSSLLSRALSLRMLTVQDVVCTKADCEGHNINLSDHTHLSSLYLRGCNQMCISDGNNTHLERVQIIDCKYSHNLLSSLSSFLSQAVLLRTLKVSSVACTKENCESHCIDLSNHTQLSSLYLHGCNEICVSDGNNIYFETCTTTGCNFPHGKRSSLSSFLSRAVSSRSLAVEDAACTKGDSEGQSIDLSDRTQL